MAFLTGLIKKITCFTPKLSTFKYFTPNISTSYEAAINNLLPECLHFFKAYFKITNHNLIKFIIKLKNRINRTVEAIFYTKI